MTEYLNCKSCWNYVAILLKHFSAPFRLFVCMYHIAFCVFRTFWNVWLFNCLFVRSFRPTREFFTNMESHLYRWRAANFWPMLRHLWPLSIEGFLVCRTYNAPFIMVISEDPWYSHLLPSDWQWICHYLFFLGLSRLGFEHFRFRAEYSYPLSHRSGLLQIRLVVDIYMVTEKTMNFYYKCIQKPIQLIL